MSVALKSNFDDDLSRYMAVIGQQARSAAASLVSASSQQKNSALAAIADVLDSQRQFILQENEKDLNLGEGTLSQALLDRLRLDQNRVDAMITGLHQVAGLPDPVGEIGELVNRPSGIQVGKMRVPLGVIGIIYESRPNVTIDAAALCLKSGNASILRGGKEAIHSNRAIYKCIQQGLQQAGMSEFSVQVLATTDREAVSMMLAMHESIDVIIPRGGKSLIERVAAESTIPLIKHLDGLCHVFIDDFADADKAVRIAVNAKTRRYGVCNAMETLLVGSKIASRVMPAIIEQMQAIGVELRGCERCREFSPASISLANEADWMTEYLAPILSIKIIDNVDEAIEHINRYGSHHTDAIVSENYSRTREFTQRVDSSSVMVNASTAFADGFEYGLGAEIGISTDKLHARGPVGLQGLTSQKYIVFGSGQVRD